MVYTVYLIVNPITRAPFYVGETNNYARRCDEHLRGTDQISGQVIRKIKCNGFVPLFVVLEEHDYEETALRAEIFWIETLLARGVKLVNSQAFTGWKDRRQARETETSQADRMMKLRKVANGKRAIRTGAKAKQPRNTVWAKSKRSGKHARSDAAPIA